ncbi:MAG: TolC family protein [Bacteroidota bacterium]
MKFYKQTLMLLCVLSVQVFYAQEKPQEIVTLEDAIAMGLQNNTNLQIVAKETDIAVNNVYQGNAGLLPTVNLIGAAQYSNNQNETTIRTFQPQPPTISFDENGVENETYSAVIQADYSLLGGFAGKYRFKLLQNQSTIAGLQEEAVINATVVAITEIFTEIAKLQSREELIQESINITQKRLDKINDRKQFGQATGLDVLRAQTDLNKEKSVLDDVVLAKQNLIKDLNQFIGKETKALYRVNVNYLIPEMETMDAITAQVQANNIELKLAQKGITAANHQIDLAKSAYLPKVNFFANYGYFEQRNDLQQLAETQNLGFTVGARVRFNIFNGNTTKRTLANAKIQLEREELRIKDVKSQVLTQTNQTVQTITTLKQQLVREETNLNTFEETFRRTEEQYYNGQATTLDLRETQTALLNAKIAITDLKLKLIATTIRLKSLTGSLKE